MISSLNEISLNSTGDVVGVREVHGVAHAEGEPLRLGAQTGASWLRLGGTAKYGIRDRDVQRSAQIDVPGCANASCKLGLKW